MRTTSTPLISPSSSTPHDGRVDYYSGVESEGAGGTSDTMDQDNGDDDIDDIDDIDDDDDDDEA